MAMTPKTFFWGKNQRRQSQKLFLDPEPAAIAPKTFFWSISPFKLEVLDKNNPLNFSQNGNNRL